MRHKQLITSLALLLACGCDGGGGGGGGGAAGTGGSAGSGGTAGSGGSGGDSTPPAITQVFPADQATGILLGIDIWAEFDEAIDCSTLTTSTVSVFAGAKVNGVATCDNPGGVGRLTFAPDAALAPSVEHSITILPDIADAGGNQMVAPYMWRFTTGSGASFSVDTYPARVNATPLGITGTKASGDAVYVDGSEAVAAGVETTWQTDLTLVEGANSFSVAPHDGASLGTPVIVDVELDTVAPGVSAALPADQATGVATNTRVRVLIDEWIDCGSVGQSTLSIAEDGINLVPGAVSCADAGATSAILLVPSAPLTPSASFTATLDTDFTDLAGNAPPSQHVWTFDTAAGPDSTPPADPQVTSAVPPTTTASTLVVSGTKDAGASVEARYTLDSSDQHGYVELVPIDGLTTWSATFPLQTGVNLYTLRSVDMAANASCDDTAVTCTVSFTTEVTSAVATPTVDFVTPTTALHQTISGTKGANTGIQIDDVTVVPVSAATTWDYELRDLTASPGSNNFTVRAIDGGGATSARVNMDIVYNEPAVVNASAEVVIELELADMWNLIGDEFALGSCGGRINHFGVDIWIEGPLTVDPGDSSIEPCRYDTPNFERKYPRYLATVVRGYETWTDRYVRTCTVPTDCPKESGGGDNSCIDNWCIGEQDPAVGWWHYGNYRAPNLLAALITSGQWTSATHPIAADIDRRNGQGLIWQPREGSPCSPLHYLDGSNCLPRMKQLPMVDGMTEATVAPGFQKTVAQNATLPDPMTATDGDGGAIGDWRSGKLTYHWDLTDKNGSKVREGAYLVSVLITLDRAVETQPQYVQVEATDRETCWDDPAHDGLGAHRAEGVIIIGSNDVTEHWAEKGAAETVDDPPAGATMEGVDLTTEPSAGLVACDWDGIAGLDDWCDAGRDDGQTGIDQDTMAGAPHCPAPATATGSDVKYLVTPTGESWPQPVRVRYCATAACP